MIVSIMAILSCLKFQGGKSSRIVNCILALKSYSEWKQTGGNGVWKFGGNSKPVTSGKNFVRKNSEPFKNSLSRNMSMNETSMSTQLVETENSKMVGNLSSLPPSPCDYLCFFLLITVSQSKWSGLILTLFFYAA